MKHHPRKAVSRFSRRVASAVFVKVRDDKGFALAEQLLSVVFLGLLCIVIAAGLNAAMQAYRTANESTRANELLARAVQEVGDELAFSLSAEAGDDGPVFVSPTTKTPVKLGNAAGGGGIALIEQASGTTSAAGTADSPSVTNPADIAHAAGMAGTAGATNAADTAGAPSETLLVASSLDPMQSDADSRALVVAISNVTYNADPHDNGSSGTFSFHIDVKLGKEGRILAGTDMTVARIGNTNGL